MVLILLVSAVVAFSFGAVIIHYNHLHAQFSADHDVSGVQKFHAKPVPRIGGISVIAGLCVGCSLLAYLSGSWLSLLLLISCMPAFCAGLLEDLTKRVGPWPRLLSTFLSAGSAFFLIEAGLSRVGLPGVDALLEQWCIMSFLLTVFAVGGVAHAVNIIDGYNGLSGFVAILILLAMCYVAFQVRDFELVGICCVMIGAVGGFLFLNFPRGLIFVGDGGAYLIGFMIAEISLLLVHRHTDVSPWFPLLCMIYPVVETVFSMYRRKFLQHRSIGYPDALHLHQLIYKRVVLWMIGSKDVAHLIERNSLTSPYLWIFASFAIVPAVLFWDSTRVLIGFVVSFILGYIYIYRRIVRFRTPRWMLLRKST